MEKIKEKILSEIEKTMEARNMSQGEVARLTGMDRRNVNKTLRGTERGVSIEQLIRIANAIGLDVDVTIKMRKD